jgi:Protein of unknown function (DUF2637)
VSTHRLRTLTWTLVGAIAALAFLVSFEAISAYAVAVGAFPHSLRWCAPLLVDTFTVAACLVILARSRDGVRAVYAWCLVVAASAVSVSLNIAHAPPTLAARLVSALPPAALLAALELVMSEARRTRSAPSAQPKPAPKVRTPRRSAQPAQPVHSAQPDSARARVQTLLAEDVNVSAERVMEATGVKRRRAYELLRQERAALKGDRAA